MSCDAFIDALIDDVAADAFDRSEELASIFALLEEHVDLPFKAMVCGQPAVIEDLQLSDRDEIVAVYTAGSRRSSTRVLDLEMSEPPLPGTDWINAYRRWAARQC